VIDVVGRPSISPIYLEQGIEKAALVFEEDVRFGQTSLSLWRWKMKVSNQFQNAPVKRTTYA